MQLLLYNKSVQSCDLVCDYIIFIGDAEQSFIHLLLQDQLIQNLLIVGHVMKLKGNAETIRVAITASQPICC